MGILPRSRFEAVHSLSDRDVQERLVERGIDVTDAAIRAWRHNK